MRKGRIILHNHLYNIFLLNRKMDKLKARVYKEVVEDMSAHSGGTAKFIEEKMEKAEAREKIFVQEVISLFFVSSFCFQCYGMLLAYME